MSEYKDFPLGIVGFQFSDLYRPEKLKELHGEFWKFAGQMSPASKQKFEALRTQPTTKPEESTVLIEVARLVGDFVSRLFNVASYTSKVKAGTTDLYSTFRFKRDFLNIRVFKRLEESPISDAEFKTLDERVKKFLSFLPPLTKEEEERAVADVVTFLLDCEKKAKTTELDQTENRKIQLICSQIHGGTTAEKITDALSAFEEWCVQRYLDPVRRRALKDWISYVRPHKLDFEHLVETEMPNANLPEMKWGPSHHLRPRDGFKLTDLRMSTKQYLREVDYCIYCHQRDKDSCSKGFPEKAGGYKKNALGIPLKGCPLDERISEMQFLRKEGEVIASLAMIMLDNPMCPGTGHRICNDCMKGCIFQKQDPVNIPQNETGVLTEVLNLPYGFEIYSLLTRFNPLNQQRPYALPYNGKNVMVVGLGPAGYTLCHYLANEGFGVTGIDALKLEPVDPLLTGKGKPFPKAIHNYGDLKKELDERILMGFGGVSEYGITVRWDKNFLAVIYLTLLRRQNLRFYGGVRFGGTLNLEDAWSLGFHHVAIATGAGRPTIVNMKNNLIKGIRKASDFLMGLQLTGAFKKSSLANLQVRLPALVIGGGLTAVDTATELLAYYPVQVEKALERFEILSEEHGEEMVWAMCDEEEKETLRTFVEHGKKIREERWNAMKEKRAPNFINLCREWGGVSVLYRKKMSDSPAYRLNHEEVSEALEEGIAFTENLSPVEAVADKYGAVSALICERPNGEKVTLPARSVCVAAGTSPNTIYEKEFPGSFAMDPGKGYFRKHVIDEADGSFRLRQPEEGEKGAFFLSYENAGRFVSYYGDNHPDYAGNVVKAMASAKHGAPYVASLFKPDIQRAEQQEQDRSKFDNLSKLLDEVLVPTVVKVQRLTPTIVEVIVKARYAARKFEPGQFYRLQNYETYARTVDHTKLLMEGIALTGAWVDKEKDLLSMIVLEMGVSSKLCALLKPGDPVVVMGPTGTPSEITSGETVLLAGGGLGNAVLFSISRALKASGSKVLYFAGYKKPEDLFKQKEIEEATDQVIWAVDSGEPIQPGRPQDRTFVGNIVKAIDSYGRGELQGPPMFPLKTVDRILAIGSDRMMEAIKNARHGVLQPLLNPNHVGLGSINSPMQCMMKEVCAQCLQKHVDPETGEEIFIFSCYNQDQELDKVDFTNLAQRLRMNSLQEKLSHKHLEYLLKKGNYERV